MCFAEPVHARLALAALNSSLFYWFITLFFDCRHLNRREIRAFPLDPHRLARGPRADRVVGPARDLMADLGRSSEERTLGFPHATLTVQCIVPRRSKPLLDAIDYALARHYGFTKAERDFLLAYDRAYRPGPAGVPGPAE